MGNEPSLRAGLEHDQLESATAQLLIELAFLVPRGTDLAAHPISEKLKAFARATRECAVADLLRAQPPEKRLGIPSQCGHVHPEPPHGRCLLDFDHDHAHETTQGRWDIDSGFKAQPPPPPLICWWCRNDLAGPLVCNDEQTLAMCQPCAEKLANFMQPRPAPPPPQTWTEGEVAELRADFGMWLQSRHRTVPDEVLAILCPWRAASRPAPEPDKETP